jgi:hypothetical protein
MKIIFPFSAFFFQIPSDSIISPNNLKMSEKQGTLCAVLSDEKGEK